MGGELSVIRNGAVELGGRKKEKKEKKWGKGGFMELDG